MENKKVGRYELVLQNPENQDTIPLRINENEKNYLATIDKFTMNFNDIKEIVEMFRNESLLIQSLDNLEKYKLLIRYRANGEYKYIPRRSDKIPGIILNDKLRMKDLIETSTSEVIDKENLKMMGLYLIAITNKDLYEYLKTNNLLSERLRESTESFIETNSISKVREIKRELSRYKVVRGIVIGFLEFEKKYGISFYKELKQEATIVPQELKQFKPIIPDDIRDKKIKELEDDEEQLLNWDAESGYSIK